jgi:hypothetical protein
MGKTGIEAMLDTVDWQLVPRRQHAAGSDLYATHAGVLEIVGTRLRCYRLNDGRAVFDADDFTTWFASMQAQPETAGVAGAIEGGRP